LANAVANGVVSAPQVNTPFGPSAGQVLAYSGSGLIWTNPTTAAASWGLAGNSGTTPAANFLGTKDNQALQLKVNNAIALQLSPAPSVPNIVGGLAAFRPTLIASNVSGAVVAGGNAPSGGVSGFGAGDYHAVYDNDGTIGGGFGNKVGNGNADVTDAAFATVAGGVFNGAAGYAATVAGGDGNFAGGDRAAIVGGFGNQALAQMSLVGSGYLNLIQTNSTYAVIAGGFSNTISAGMTYAVISGGQQNLINAPQCSIGGGVGNSIQTTSSASSIGGGVGNLIGSSAYSSTIAGGQNNVIQNHIGAGFPISTIGGGLWNYVGGQAGVATIGGGEANTNLAVLATIAGGSGNLVQVGGDFSAIPGGYRNTASGAQSFAAGTQAQAVHTGAFVWADSQSANFSSAASDSVSFRCQGGARFFANAGATVGVQLLPNGNSWSALSDRNAKKDFESVDTRAVLETLAAMPVQRWHYKWEQENDTPHLGPMAQDFKGAFYPGRDDKSISTMEFDGVELAAIQGLNDKLEEKNADLNQRLALQAAQLKAKDDAIQALEHRLERLESLLAR
jgi:hypothetical protein